MFGPLLAERGKYPRLKEAASDAFRTLQVAQAAEGIPRTTNRRDGGLGPDPGLSSLFIDGLVPHERIKSMAKEIIGNASLQVS